MDDEERKEYELFKKFREEREAAAQPKTEAPVADSKQEQPKPTPPASAQEHQHTLKESGNHVFCEGCGSNYIPAKNAEDVMKALNSMYHKDTHDTLKCKQCRGPLLDAIKGSGDGYDVDEDRDGEIRIKPKRKGR